MRRSTHRLAPIIRSLLLGSLLLASVQGGALAAQEKPGSAFGSGGAIPVEIAPPGAMGAAAPNARALPLSPPVPLLLRAVRGAAEAKEPLDLRIARWARDPALQDERWLRGTAGALRFATLPGTLILSGALVGIGELRDDRALRDAGVRTGEAVLAAGAVSGMGKLLLGRARPHHSPDDPHDWGFGRGLRGDAYQSFPSAHAAIAFATTTVGLAALVEGHPGRVLWAGPLLYGVASGAALSRLYHDEHWASDIVAGSALGLLTGWLVVIMDR